MAKIGLDYESKFFVWRRSMLKKGWLGGKAYDKKDKRHPWLDLDGCRDITGKEKGLPKKLSKEEQLLLKGSEEILKSKLRKKVREVEKKEKKVKKKSKKKSTKKKVEKKVKKKKKSKKKSTKKKVVEKAEKKVDKVQEKEGEKTKASTSSKK